MFSSTVLSWRKKFLFGFLIGVLLLGAQASVVLADDGATPPPTDPVVEVAPPAEPPVEPVTPPVDEVTPPTELAEPLTPIPAPLPPVVPAGSIPLSCSSAPELTAECNVPHEEIEVIHQCDKTSTNGCQPPNIIDDEMKPVACDPQTGICYPVIDLDDCAAKGNCRLSKPDPEVVCLGIGVCPPLREPRAPESPVQITPPADKDAPWSVWELGVARRSMSLAPLNPPFRLLLPLIKILP